MFEPKHCVCRTEKMWWPPQNTNIHLQTFALPPVYREMTSRNKKCRVSTIKNAFTLNANKGTITITAKRMKRKECTVCTLVLLTTNVCIFIGYFNLVNCIESISIRFHWLLKYLKHQRRTISTKITIYNGLLVVPFYVHIFLFVSAFY